MATIAVNGVDYNVERAGAGPPLVLLHGFTGSAATWVPHLPALAREFDTIAIDLLGHGQSTVPADSARYEMARVVEDLDALLDRLGLARAVWLGYSMGARVALHLAVARPERVTALVLEGVSPGIRGPAERSARARSDDELAGLIEREGVAAFVDRWERLPLFASQLRLPAAVRMAVRRQRLANDSVGLANSLRGLGQGVQLPLHDRLAAVEVPTLLVVGGEDEKFRRLAAEMVAVLPAARVAVVAAAGHAAHLEQPDEFWRVVLDFLRSIGTQ